MLLNYFEIEKNIKISQNEDVVNDNQDQQDIQPPEINQNNVIPEQPQQPAIPNQQNPIQVPQKQENQQEKRNLSILNPSYPWGATGRVTAIVRLDHLSNTEDSKLASFCKKYVAGLKKGDGTYPSWVMSKPKFPGQRGFKPEAKSFFMFSKAQMDGPYFHIIISDKPAFSAITKEIENLGYDVTPLRNLEGNEQEQQPQQNQQALDPKAIEVVTPSWDSISIRFNHNANVINFIRQERINGNELQLKPITSYVFSRERGVVPSQLLGLAHEFKKEGYKIEEFVTAVEKYDQELSERNLNRVDPNKIVTAIDISARTKFLMKIQKPVTPKSFEEMSDFIKFSFPSRGDLTDLRLEAYQDQRGFLNEEPVEPGQPQRRNPPTGMRLDQEDGWCIHGTFDDFVRFSRLLKKSQWNVQSIRTILSAMMNDGRIEKTRYSGQLDGYEVLDEKGNKVRENGEFKQDYEKFFKEVDVACPGVNLFKKQKQGVAWLYQRNSALLGDDTGCGKCLLGNSTIFINGKLMTMEEVWKNYSTEQKVSDNEKEEWCLPSEKLIVNNFNGKEITTTEVGGLFRQKYKGKLRKIKTWNGKTVTTTYEHKFLTPTGWSNNIKIDDCIISPRFLPPQIENYTDCSNEFAELLGWQISEGCEIEQTTRITQKDIPTLELIQKAFRKIAFDNNIKNIKTNNIYESKIIHINNKSSELVICSKNYVQFLESKGYLFGKKSKDKQIPTYILHAKDSAVKSFLRAYFSAEGHCSTKARRIELTSASKKLIWQISYMLGRFGIQHCFNESMKCATNGTKIKRPYYRIFITGSGVESFIKEIGFSCDYKNKAFTNQTQYKNPNKEGKPLGHILSPFFEKHNIPSRRLGIRDKNYITGKKWASNDTINKFIEKFKELLSGESFEQYETLKKSKWTEQTCLIYKNVKQESIEKAISGLEEIRDSDLQYEKIISVEEEEYDNYIYDLTIPNNKNYVAEGLVCHNTVETLTAAKMRLQQSGGRCIIFTIKNAQFQWVRELQNLLGENARDISTNPSSNAKWVIMAYNDISSQPKRGPQGLLKSPTGAPLVARKASQDYLDALFTAQWTVAIFDEAHILKNDQTGTARNIEALSPKIPFKWGASATFAANTALDIHNVLSIVGHPLGKLSTRDFTKEFVGAKASMKNMKAEDVVALQEKGAYNLRKWLTLSGAYLARSQKAMNPDIPDHTIGEEPITQEDFDMEDFAHELARLTKTYHDGSAAITLLTGKRVVLARKKVPHTVAQAKAIIDSGDRVLIFSCFKETCNQLVSQLDSYIKTIDPDLKVVHIKDGDKGTDIKNAVDAFKEADSMARVMVIASLKGGTGISLENSTQHVLMNDFDWTPRVCKQTEGRAFRINNFMPVDTRYMVVQGNITNEKGETDLNPDALFYRYVRSKIKIAQIIQELDSKAEETLLAGMDDTEVQKDIQDARAEDRRIQVQLAEDLNNMMRHYGEEGIFDPDNVDLDKYDEMGELKNGEEPPSVIASSWYRKAIG